MSLRTTFQAIIRHLFADSSNVTLTDDGVTVTGDLTDTAVTPGSYTNSSITVDQKGRLTAASSAANTANLQAIDQDLATTDNVTFNRVNIATISSVPLNIESDIAINAWLTTNNDDASTGSNISLRRTRGMQGAPTAVQNGDNLGDLICHGYDGSSMLVSSNISTISDGTFGSFASGYMIFQTRNTTVAFTPLQLNSDGGVLMAKLKSGATQAGAGAAANELWVTSGHATLPDNVVLRGV